jgi:hypothetical protein
MTVRPLAVGDVIHGFAHGAFGRDHYHCVRVEAVGPDWIVARDPTEPFHGPSFTSGRRSLELCIQSRDEPCSHAAQRRWDEEDPRCPLARPVAQQEAPLTTHRDQ